MALTERQLRYYASAPAGEVQQKCISLFHDAFDHPHHLTLWHKPFSAQVRGELVDFEYHPFDIALPKQNGNGQQDLQVSTFITSEYFVQQLQAAAANPESSFEIEYNQYFPDSPEASRSPLSLSVFSIAVNGGLATLTAKRSDVLNRSFLGLLYTPDLFRGLVR